MSEPIDITPHTIFIIALIIAYNVFKECVRIKRGADNLSALSSQRELGDLREDEEDD